MKYELDYSPGARVDLKSLPETISKRIIAKLDFFVSQDNPLAYAQKLAGKYHGCYKFRIGNYRAVFQLTESGQLKILFILKIQHRKDIYRP